MQNVRSLSFEAIPCRFCEAGVEGVDFAVVSADPSGALSYFNGLSLAFTNPGCFIKRQHVNAIGRLGTTAQAIMQCGGHVGYVLRGVTYPIDAVVMLFDGCAPCFWISLTDANDEYPPCSDERVPIRVMGSSEVADGIPDGSRKWAIVSVPYGKSFFDVS